MDLSVAQTTLEHVREYFNVSALAAFNWGEPLLCKNIREYVHLFSSFEGLYVCFSSNMNIKIPASLVEEILPYIHNFKFSVSGFSQSVYEKYHRGGKIKKVIENIELFVDAKRKTNAQTQFEVVFGKHLYNAHEEEHMRRFCDMHDIQFSPLRYYVTDVQDLYEVYKGNSIPKERYNLFYNSFSDLNNDVKTGLTPHVCRLLSNDIVVDSKGYLMTCCATKISTGISILDIKDIDTLNQVRLNNSFCKKCFEIGLNGYYFKKA